VNYQEQYEDPLLQQLADEYQIQVYGQKVFRDGMSYPIGAAFVQETTVFREFGPLAGNTMRLAYQISPRIGDSLSQQTVDGDVRYYKRLAGSGLLAFRARGFKSWGDYPNFFFFGGNSELRGYDYLAFAGNEGYFANVELRFPLVNAMATPIGILGGVRGVFFFGLGGAHYEGDPYSFATSKAEQYRPIIDYTFDPVIGSCPFTDRRSPSMVSDFATAARRTGSASRRSRSASPSTSTGRGGRCSTGSGRTRSSTSREAPTRSASRGSRSGSATTSSRPSSNSTRPARH